MENLNKIVLLAIVVFAAVFVILFITLGSNGIFPVVKTNSTSNNSTYNNESQTQNQTQKVYCTDSSRKGDACIALYKPVCGWFNASIQCVKYPCAQTYSNSCPACLDKKVEYYTEGVCPT